MPLYEYQCQQCGHRFEKIQSFSAPDEKACPSCGGPVERLISAPAIQFKGAGWYVNDYAGRSKAPSAGSSEDKSSSSDKSSSDSKSKNSGGKDVSASSSDGSSSSSSKSESGSKSDTGAGSKSSAGAASSSGSTTGN